MYIVKLSYYDNSDVLKQNEFFSGFGAAFVPKYEIFEPVIETAMNSVGHFSFTVYPSHPLYEFADKPKAIIEVTKQGREQPLFTGRLTEKTLGFYNEKRLVFESELAFLLDSVRTNFNSVLGYSAKFWLENILNYHNNHAGNLSDVYTDNIQRKFYVGNVSQEILVQSVNIPAEKFKGTYTTLDIIRMLLLNKCGGVLKIRHENNKSYIDWLSDDDLHTCMQKIQLANNLLDIENTSERAEIVSAIRPVGENVTLENGLSVPLDIMMFDASAYIVNDDICQAIDETATEASALKFTDTMYSKELVKKYGWIQKEVFFSGVVNKNALVRSAERFLRGVTEKNNITIKAVDLSAVDISIEDFEAGDLVLLNSPAHFLGERKFQINSVVLNLCDPSESVINVGTGDEGIVSQIVNGSSSVSAGGYWGGGYGKYDAEGSAQAALSAAKKYTDSVADSKVDKENGKGLSTNDFTDSYKNQVDTNLSDISGLKTKVSINSTDISELKKSVTANTGNISSLTSKVTDHDASIKTNTGKIDTIEGNITKLQEADVEFARDLISVIHTANIADSKADQALERNEFTDEEKSKLAGITNPMVIKGTVASVSDLPTVAETGWFYFVGEENAEYYEEYCYSQSGWEYVGLSQEGIDLSDYYTKTETETLISYRIDGFEAIRLGPVEDKVDKAIQLLVNKADSEDVYTKTETDTKISDSLITFENIKLNAVEDKVDRNTQLIANNAGSISALDTRVTDIESEINGLNSSVEYMSEHKANTTTVTANTNAISALDTRVASAESKITALGLTDTRHSDQITQNAMNIANNLAKIEANTNDITVTKDTLGYSQKNLIKKLTQGSRTENGITFTVNSDNSITINGTATAYADFYIYGGWGSTAPVLSKPQTYAISMGSEFANSGMKGFIITNGTWAMREFTTSETEWTVTDDVANTHITSFMMRVPQGVTVDNLTVYPMIRYSFITDDTYEPYVESVNERFNRFTVQNQLYGNNAVSDSVLTLTVKNLFKKYSAVICNVITDNGIYSQVLPLKYIKSLGTDTFYQAEQLLYYYVDDSTMTIRTGLGQVNPDITQVQIIGLY